MAKIPFEIKFRPQIESGEYKVETRDGRPVEIISFELTDTNGCPIAAKFRLCAGTPVVYLFDENGKYRGEGASDYDIFIITPEPELTEWQRSISACLQKHGLLDCGAADRIAKESAAELLELARKEVLNDLPRWKKIKEVTTKRTEGDHCVTTETLLVKGWMYSDDYRIIEPNCMVNREMLCIPVRLLYKLPGFKKD